MHATLQNLTGLRDGEPVDACVAQHVADCAACRQELTRLSDLRAELRRLPAFAPPAAWSRIDATLTQPVLTRRRLQPVAALIACVVAALAVVWSGAHWSPRQLRPSTVSATTLGAGTEPLESLVNRSQQLEAILQSLPQRPAVEHASTSAAIDALQSRIQLLDAQLARAQQEQSSDEPSSDNQDAQRLWQERVQLLNTLVSVRYAESARSGYWPATTGVI